MRLLGEKLGMSLLGVRLLRKRLLDNGCWMASW